VDNWYTPNFDRLGKFPFPSSLKFYVYPGVLPIKSGLWDLLYGWSFTLIWVLVLRAKRSL